MGSLDDDGNYAKGESPTFDWVRRHLERHNAACRNRAMAAPLRLKLLAWCGYTKPFYAWQEKQPLQNYYPK